jgi:hypothetical protein
MTELVCVTVLVTVWIEVFVSVEGAGVVVVVLVMVNGAGVTVWVTVVVVGGWLEAVVVETLVEVVLVVVDVVEVDVVVELDVVEVDDDAVVVDVVVVVDTAGAVYSKVVSPVAPWESVAAMTYVPVTHEAPPICVEYEKVPEAVTAWVEESIAEEEPKSVTRMDTLSRDGGVGLIVAEIV